MFKDEKLNKVPVQSWKSNPVINKRLEDAKLMAEKKAESEGEKYVKAVFMDYLIEEGLKNFELEMQA